MAGLLVFEQRQGGILNAAVVDVVAERQAQFLVEQQGELRAVSAAFAGQVDDRKSGVEV
mgnify:CR=1 FL=1